ncbi:hypothetical protein C7S15_7939 [Burkholderia cepacia]|nr:hypothetical protein [Burkholderia cepacia]
MSKLVLNLFLGRLFRPMPHTSPNPGLYRCSIVRIVEVANDQLRLAFKIIV